MSDGAPKPEARERLPDRRQEIVATVAHNGESFHVGFGLYPDGRLGEVFVAGGKVGSDLRVAALEASVALSFALQCGADADAMRRAFPRAADGAPEGLMGAILDTWAAMRLEPIRKVPSNA